MTSTVASGTFYCPECDRIAEYVVEATRRVATLFFLPMSTLDELDRYLVCKQCGRKFSEEVLNSRPPTEAQRRYAAAYASLLNGVSLGMTQSRMMQEWNMTAEQAEAILAELCEGPPKRCACGRRFHPSLTRCPECEGRL